MNCESETRSCAAACFQRSLSGSVVRINTCLSAGPSSSLLIVATVGVSVSATLSIAAFKLSWFS